MNEEEELEVEVVDRRMQTNFDGEAPLNDLGSSGNQFMMPEQGFESRKVEEEEDEEEGQDEQPQYKLEKMLPKQNQKQRLIEQNIKLKTQIYELAKQLDEILVKQRAKKKNYGIGLNKIDQQEEHVREKRLQVQKQQMQLDDLRNKIFIARRQLDTVYNNDMLQAKEDEIKTLKNKLKGLQNQKDGHLNIQRVQSKALKVVKNQEQYKEKLNNVMNETAELRKGIKLQLQKIAVKERILYKGHDGYVGKREKMKELEQKLALNKEKAKSKKTKDQFITEEMIEGLEQEIRQLQADRREGEKIWQEKIKLIDIELIHKRNQEEKKLLILREKQKQLTLNKLRIKQLRKLAKHMEEGPGSSRKVSQDMDMSQFRHKRNIRYMDK